MAISGWVSQLPAGAEGAPYRLSLFLGCLLLKKLTKNETMIIIILSGNVARKNGGTGLWHVGRLCLATAPLGLRMWTIHAAPWKGKRPDLSHRNRKTSLSDSPRNEEYALGGTHMLPFTLDSPSEVKAPSPVAVVIGQRVRLAAGALRQSGSGVDALAELAVAIHTRFSRAWSCLRTRCSSFRLHQWCCPLLRSFRASERLSGGASAP
eukprot:scaffold8329_cov112-Isochrysis_galbana.AAC.3